MVLNSVSCLVIGFFCVLCSVLESSLESHRSPVFWALRTVWRFGVRPVHRSVLMSLWGFRGKSVGRDSVVSVRFSVGHGVGVASPTRYYSDVGVLFASLEVGVSITRYPFRKSIRVHGSPRSVGPSPTEVCSLCCVCCRSICVEGMLHLSTSDCVWTCS